VAVQENSVAVVTGGASGIGRATALVLARAGWQVMIADIAEQRAAAVVAEIADGGGRAMTVRTDVSCETEVQAMVQSCVRQLGPPQALCNLAADLGETLLRDRDLMEMDVAVWDRAMAVNLRVVMLTTKHLLPYLVDRRSSIVNCSSVAASAGDTQRFAYGASKAAIIALTKYTATSYGHRGVRCNAVAPGLVMTDVARERLDGRAQQVARAKRLLAEECSPEDVAEVVCFLASPRAAAVTGTVVTVDSGCSAHGPGYTQGSGNIPPGGY